MLKRSYFAAANGYSGFRSYFDSIFIPEKYRRIFVLKGGPGTGKSTLMKRIAYYADNEDIDYEKIHCSSDPDSLDGIIINTTSGCYAIVDGTAPHQRDAVIPGAIDTIINLGDSFNISYLESQREKIINIDKRKKDAYNAAYSYLHIAGEIKNKIGELITKSFNYQKAKHIASTIESFTIAKKQIPQIALKSAFGKGGYYTLKDFASTETIFRISGKYGEEMEFLRLLLDNARQKYDYISFDPLSQRDPDAAISSNVYFTCTTELSAEFDAGECLNVTVSREELEFLKETHNSTLKIAQKHFENAALLHSELEDIYRDAMDFTHNDRIINEIINCII